MNYKTLMQQYPKRHMTKIVNVTRSSPLGLTDILVFSCLVNRATHNKGCRQSAISRATSLHESTAVPAALKRLLEHGLAEKRGRYWWAVEPTAEKLTWFRFRKGTEEQKWARRFSYWWTGIRRRKASITTPQTLLYFKLVNLNDYGRRITVRGLAKLLGIDPKTVILGLKMLKAEKLVDAELFANAPTPEQLLWFKKGHEKPPFRLSEHFFFPDDDDDVHLSKPLVDRLGQLLLAASFSERQAVEYFQSVLRTAKRWPVVFAFVSSFEKFFKGVDDQHWKNVAAGKYNKAKNCRGFLNSETAKRLASLRHARIG